CPSTRQPLRWREPGSDVSHAPWRKLAERYGLGDIVGVLETEDGALAYPAWAGLYGLLAEFAQARTGTAAPALRAEKRNVAKFYDDFGWIEAEEGRFNDAVAFEDLRDVTAFYRRACHRRVGRHLRGGRYLLDAASGPVQLEEYRAFSAKYERRICVDLSLRGLRKAQERLGEHAICVAADITALPLRDGVVDGFVSLHTIYHVPADEQARAFAELHRALEPGGRGVVVYSWGASSWLHRAAARLDRRFTHRPPLAEATPIALPADADLYFKPHDYAWYHREIAAHYACRLRVWRSVGKEFMERFVRSRLGAALILGPLLARS